MDTYNDFAELSRNAQEGVDFRVRVRHRPGTTVVLAPHGGGIEPGTSEIAETIAGDELSLYVFEGIRQSANWELHLSSTRFDEPRCVALVTASPDAIAVHGEDSGDEIVFLGGRDEAMLDRLRDSLVANGFNVETHGNPALQGRDEANICNRVQSRRGVQMELSNGLRSTFFGSLTRAGRRIRTERFAQFVGAVRQAVVRSRVL